MAEQDQKKKRMRVVLVAVVAAAAAAWWFFLSPNATSDEGKQEAKAGEVLTLESIQVNLASGHYLRVGVALQLTDTAGDVSGAQALDETIKTFSGLPVAQVNSGEFRDKLQKTLVERLAKRYDGAVLDVFFTDYVTQ